MRLSPIAAVALTVLCLSPLACSPLQAAEPKGEEHEGHHAIVATHPLLQNVDTTQQYVSQIHARRHIELRALEPGYLEEVRVQEGQAVKAGELMFEIMPVVYKARLHADKAELQSADITLRNTKMLYEKDVVSDQELALAQAERAKAKAKVALATAELGFTEIRAPFDGIMDRQFEQQGSLLEEGAILTTVSDNSVMWVYFNVPEADYLDYRMRPGAVDPDSPQKLNLPGAQIQLKLANGKIFEQSAGDIVTIESDFDNETGNIQFRADFPNPDGLLRHGQTGTLLIHQTMKDAVVIPQRSVFEILDKHYVFVIDTDGVAHQRPIQIEYEKDDIFVVSDGLAPTDTVVLEGVRQLHDGERVEPQMRDAEEVLADLKHHAE